MKPDRISLKRAALSLAVVALAAPFARADVHMEVALSGVNPDGADDLLAQFDSWTSTTYSVWVWSDEPGVRISGLTFDISAGLGYTVESLGTVDPANTFSLVSTNAGTANAGEIDGVSAFVADPINGFTLPTGVQNAWLVYADFKYVDGPFGLVPPGRVDATSVGFAWVLSQSPVNLQTHGVQTFIEPTPGSASVFAIGLLGLTRRRRGA